MGEKPPKANWLLGLAGVVILGAGYYFAVTIEDPMTVLFGFFLAVALVVVGTYLIFVAGSVVLCRILQKNKRYYYKPNHFVSVSSMAYRMKRNGAGLASICILATSVLVILSAGVSLVVGINDVFRQRYPTDFSLEIGSYSQL
ncbi:MAG: ABC transporter permease, partial [Clostridiales bacterium]|nr:ABC transporter permease [Clostridiales bacterium]